MGTTKRDSFLLPGAGRSTPEKIETRPTTSPGRFFTANAKLNGLELDLKAGLLLFLDVRDGSSVGFGAAGQQLRRAHRPQEARDQHAKLLCQAVHHERVLCEK